MWYEIPSNLDRWVWLPAYGPQYTRWRGFLSYHIVTKWIILVTAPLFIAIFSYIPFIYDKALLTGTLTQDHTAGDIAFFTIFAVLLHVLVLLVARDTVRLAVHLHRGGHES